MLRKRPIPAAGGNQIAQAPFPERSVFVQAKHIVAGDVVPLDRVPVLEQAVQINRIDRQSDRFHTCDRGTRITAAKQCPRQVERRSESFLQVCRLGGVDTIVDLNLLPLLLGVIGVAQDHVAHAVLLLDRHCGRETVQLQRLW